MRNRRRLKAACLGRPALLLGGLFFLPFLARHLLPLAFFHQNGQGPLWLELALCRPTSDYGPGYSKLFGALASFGAADPEPQVVLAIGALMATVPPAAYLIARQVGAGPRIAGIVAAAAAVDPLSARLARSESYYAVICPLLVLATCAALAGARSRRRGDLTLGAAAAGLLVAVSAQVHPLSWLPSALVTAPVLVAGGFGVGHLGTRRAVTRFLATTVIVGAIAAILSLPSMLAVIRGPLGARWLSPAGESTREAGVVVPLVVALLVVASAKDRRRALVRGGAVFFSGLAYAITRSTYRGSVAIGGAHDRLYLGVAIALGAGVIAAAKWPVGLTKPRIAALLTIPIGLWMALRAPDWVRLPTDAQEQALVRRWRARWTGEDRLVFLSRAGERRVLLLPLYSCVEEHPRILPLSTDDLASAAVPGGSHYLHSSLCSTDEGEAACTAFERVMAREPLEHRTLPARASIPGLEYRGGRVEVRLSRLLHER
ncbi:MAG TPA: hypothetical protein ENK57_14505 [Polyangiaceae bacterium]|nr:hypothetical protein [Polyangiaceae bacterium]